MKAEGLFGCSLKKIKFLTANTPKEEFWKLIKLPILNAKLRNGRSGLYAKYFGKWMTVSKGKYWDKYSTEYYITVPNFYIKAREYYGMYGLYIRDENGYQKVYSQNDVYYLRLPLKSGGYKIEKLHRN